MPGRGDALVNRAIGDAAQVDDRAGRPGALDGVEFLANRGRRARRETDDADVAFAARQAFCS